MSMSRWSKYEAAVTMLVCIVVIALFTVVSPPIPRYMGEHGLSSQGIIFFATVFLVGALYALWLLYRLHCQRIEEVRYTEREKAQQSHALVDLHVKLLESLALKIEAKDQTTRGHVRRTQIYAIELGKKLNISKTEIEALRFGALFHDIGKLAVPELLLNKPGKLSDAEFARVQTHTDIAGDLLKSVNYPYAVEAIARFHHERWDGKGYPKGLKGEAIPLVARIMAVVDFYDKARCNRPYREGNGRDEVIKMLEEKSGNYFDPNVVETFISNMDEFDSHIAETDLQEQLAGKPVSEKAEVEVVEKTPSQHLLSVEAANELALLSVLAQNFSSSLGINDTLTLLTDKLQKIIPFNSCVFYLNDKKDKVVPAHVAGENAEELSHNELEMNKGVTGWAMANTNAINSQLPQMDFYDLKDEVSEEYKSALSVPLKTNGAVFGALTLYNSERNAYTNEHQRILEMISLHAANAIHNALMYEKNRETALFDTLTGLPNNRAFYLTLDQRIAECQRLNQEDSLTVVSIDLDNFKQINETYNHEVGDKLLIAVADLIKGQLRSMDFLARYGGDEFIAILPHASYDMAQAVGERIKTAVETHLISVGTDEPIEALISVGVASYPQDGEVSFELLSAANRKMYRQKQSRKTSAFSDGNSNVIPFDNFR